MKKVDGSGGRKKKKERRRTPPLTTFQSSQGRFMIMESSGTPEVGGESGKIEGIGKKKIQAPPQIVAVSPPNAVKKKTPREKAAPRQKTSKSSGPRFRRQWTYSGGLSSKRYATSWRREKEVRRRLERSDS